MINNQINLTTSLRSTKELLEDLAVKANTHVTIEHEDHTYNIAFETKDVTTLCKYLSQDSYNPIKDMTYRAIIEHLQQNNQ